MNINNFKFKKNLGQNFLIDQNITRKISNIFPNDNSLVVEIGCGDGRLTKELCKNYSYVLGYEIDLEVKNYLENNLKEFNNYSIKYCDFLLQDINKNVNIYNYNNLFIIANLPYYITTAIIEKIITSGINPNAMVFMVQKEVGDRFCAKAGTKLYNSLTVYLNYYFDIKKEFVVNRNSFLPKPNVDSIVISFKQKIHKADVFDEKHFFKLVRDSFKYKRKNLKNNLISYNLGIIEEVLKKYNFTLSVRAEQLDLNIFVDISNNLVKTSI